MTFNPDLACSYTINITSGSACSGSALFVENDKSQPSRIKGPDVGDLILFDVMRSAVL